MAPFQQVVYINLDRSPDRRQRVEAQLDASDLRAVPRVRVPAVDGKALPFSVLQAVLTPVALAEVQDVEAGTRVRTHHSQLTLGGVGCYMSHMQVWAHIAAMRGDPHALVLVLEDDATVAPDVGEVLGPAAAQFAALDAATPDVPKLVLWAVFAGPTVPLSRQSSLQDLTVPWWSMQAYTLTPRTAQALITHPDLARVDVQVDSALQLARDIRVLISNRMPATSGGTSTIQAAILPTAPRFRPGVVVPHPSPVLASSVPVDPVGPVGPVGPVASADPTPSANLPWEMMLRMRPAMPSPVTRAGEVSMPTWVIVLIVVVVIAAALGLGLGLGLGTKS